MLRRAFGEYGGVEADTQADAFFVAFARAPDAAAAADEAQRSLADGPSAFESAYTAGNRR